MEYLELVIRDLEIRTNEAIKAIAGKLGMQVSLSDATYQITAASKEIADKTVPVTKGNL